MFLKLHITILFSTIISLHAFSQNYSIGFTNQTFVDSSRNNREIGLRIYYPAQISGENASIVSGVHFFPLIAFGHGFLMNIDAYGNIWQSLVPNGYIVALPTTEGSPSPSHLNFGKDLSFCINKINNLATNPSSLFYQKVSNRSAVMGHSMGGGAAFLAAAENTSINALLTLAAAETNPSAIAAAAQLNIPSLTIAGGNDCVTPPENHQIPMYNALSANSCKVYLNILGGSHCQMALDNFICNLGEITCTPAPAISRQIQHTVINDYLLNWLNAVLKNNMDAANDFDSDLPSDNRILFEKNCLLNSYIGLKNENNSEEFFVDIYPNPVSNHMYLRNKVNRLQKVNIKVFNALGINVYEEQYTMNIYEVLQIQKSQIKVEQLGIYFINLSSNEFNISKKIVFE